MVIPAWQAVQAKRLLRVIMLLSLRWPFCISPMGSLQRGMQFPRIGKQSIEFYRTLHTHNCATRYADFIGFSGEPHLKTINPVMRSSYFLNNGALKAIFILFCMTTCLSEQPPGAAISTDATPLDPHWTRVHFYMKYFYVTEERFLNIANWLIMGTYFYITLQMFQ